MSSLYWATMCTQHSTAKTVPQFSKLRRNWMETRWMKWGLPRHPDPLRTKEKSVRQSWLRWASGCQAQHSQDCITVLTAKTVHNINDNQNHKDNMWTRRKTWEDRRVELRGSLGYAELPGASRFVRPCERPSIWKCYFHFVWPYKNPSSCEYCIWAPTKRGRYPSPTISGLTW